MSVTSNLRTSVPVRRQKRADGLLLGRPGVTARLFRERAGPQLATNRDELVTHC